MNFRKGSALVTVILTLTVLSILSITVITVITARMRLTASYSDSMSALYAAQAGIEDMKFSISSIVSSCKTYITGELDSYIKGASFDPNSDLSLRAENDMDNYFRDHLNAYKVQGSLIPAVTKYSATALYDEENNSITINSTGYYSKGGSSAEKKVSVNFRLNMTNQIFNVPAGGSGTMPPYSLIIKGPAIDQNSLVAYCHELEVTGSFYIPNGITDIAGSGTLEFDSDFEVYNDLTLSGWGKNITVGGDMKVNGNLVFGNDSSMELQVGGDLIVDGNITINGWNNKISVKGDVRCNGNIAVSADAASLDVKKNLYLAGTKSNTGWLSNISYKRLYEGYGGSIQPVNFTFGNPSVFFSHPGDPRIITDRNTIQNSLGSDKNPVVVYYNGDLNIEVPWYTNTINIYGIVYATGNINIKGYGLLGGQVNVYGSLVSGKKLNIAEEFNNYSKVVKLDYDNNRTMKNLKKDYPDIVSFFGGGGSGTNTVYVGIVSSFTATSWDE